MKKLNRVETHGNASLLYYLLPLFAALIFTFVGCGDTELTSKWRNQNITIDGNDNDWGNSLVMMDKLNALVGVQNDNNNLYLCLVTSNNDLQMKILRMGLTVWIDRTGSDDKKFGIRFPLGFRGMNAGDFQRDRSNMQEGERPNQDEIKERIINNQREMEVVGPDNEAIRVNLSELHGIQLKIGMKEGRMVYEMQIPLSFKNGANYAINADTGSTISVGLETGTFEARRNNRSEGFSSGGDGGGFQPPEGGEGGDDFGGGGMRGGGRRGEFGGRGGGRGNFNSSAMEPISFWAKVKLVGE